MMKTRGILFSVFNEIDAPGGLYEAVLARITRARQLHARRKTFLLGVISLVCGLTLVPALQYTNQELLASGFYNYMSLAFSDSTLVFSAWRVFAFSLLESLPSIALLLVLASSALLVWSLRRTIINARIAFSY
jgi:hypothetical protein